MLYFKEEFGDRNNILKFLDLRGGVTCSEYFSRGSELSCYIHGYIVL
jgi:hypothetical protein